MQRNMLERKSCGYESDDPEESVNAYINHYVILEYHSDFIESVTTAVVKFLHSENRPCSNVAIHSMVMSIEQNIDYLLEDRGKWLDLYRGNRS